jgi:hypothetical protein
MLKLINAEMSTLSADSVLNNLKIKIINKLINSERELLINEPILEYLEQLDEEMLPQNSDVVIILYQYIEALDQYKAKNKVYSRSVGTYQWNTQENSDIYKIPSIIETIPLL